MPLRQKLPKYIHLSPLIKEKIPDMLFKTYLLNFSGCFLVLFGIIWILIPLLSFFRQNKDSEFFYDYDPFTTNIGGTFMISVGFLMLNFI